MGDIQQKAPEWNRTQASALVEPQYVAVAGELMASFVLFCFLSYHFIISVQYTVIR